MKSLSVALVVVMSTWSQVATPEDRDKFVGTWTLEAIEVLGEAGNWERATAPIGDAFVDRIGKDPLGYIMYDSAGNMAVQIMRRDRRRLASDDLAQVASEEIKTAFLGYAAYFGTYEVNENEGVVTHHRKGNIVPNLVGTAAKRFYIFEGDTLTLMAARDSRLRWKRIE